MLLLRVRNFAFLFLFLVLLAGGVFLVKRNSTISRSVIETVKENLPTTSGQTKKLGAELPFPLKVNGSFNIALFAKLNAAPRVLAFDTNGILFASIPSQGKVVALPDKNNDGIVDETVDVITELNHPHGVEFNGGFVYVGEEDKLSRFKYDSPSFKVSEKTVLFDIPGGGRHTTRTVKVYRDKIYISVGSSCDVCIETTNRADIWVSNLDGSDTKVFAKGLRNTVFFNFDSNSKMWGNDMGRDFLGDNLPPDEINLIENGGDYGWPFCYGDNIRDNKFMSGENPDYCKNTTAPKYKYPAHVAPLGLIFDKDGNILASLHGSWNSSVPVGYKVVKVTNGGSLNGMQDFVTGFISGKQVLGRPVDLVFDKNGNLFISDDKADNIYIVSPK